MTRLSNVTTADLVGLVFGLDDEEIKTIKISVISAEDDPDFEWPKMTVQANIVRGFCEYKINNPRLFWLSLIAIIYLPIMAIASVFRSFI